MRNPSYTFRAIVLAILFVGVPAVGADVPAITVSNYNYVQIHTAHYSLGYTFTLAHPITITALGVMDFGGNTVGLVGGEPVALYYSNATSPNVGGTTDGFHSSGTPVAGASVLVTATDPIMAPDGSPYVSGDGFRYHFLDTPITLYSDRQASTATPVGYEIQAQNKAVGYAINWVGTTTFTDVTAPVKSTYTTDQLITGADYATTTLTGAENFGQAFFGPNFLIQTPEPTAMALAAIAPLALIRRR